MSDKIRHTRKTYILTLRKRLRKPIIPILDQRIGGFPKQKLRRTINGETKKPFTQIDFLTRNNRRNQSRDVLLKRLHIADLRAYEIRTEHFSTVLPLCTVGCEDS